MSGPHPVTLKLMNLAVGKSMFISGSASVISSARRLTGQTYSRESREGGYIVTRVS